jgi:hypothetical protein
VPRSRRRLGCVAIAALVVLVPLAFGLRGQVIPIESYRIREPDTIVLRVLHGGLSWVRVGDLAEDAATVRIEVRESAVPLGRGAIGLQSELVVDLEAPLGDRRVIDAATEGEVPRHSEP